MKRYIVCFIMLIVFIAVILLFPDHREEALTSLRSQVVTMLLIIPPIFVLLGLMDVWVPRELMIRYMGSNSALKGSIIAFALGSFAAGPLYGAFPFAAVLLKKGASLFNVMIFLGAWSTTKLPMLLFEFSSMGFRFALSRLAIDLVAIIIIAKVVNASLNHAEVAHLVAKAEQIS